MYDTARRVALVKQRVRENTRRRQRREVISLSAACMLLFAALDAGGGHGRRAGADRPHGACSARCCCGRTRAAMCWWPSSPLQRRWSITALCFRLRNRENQKKDVADKPNRHEKEEKSQ